MISKPTSSSLSPSNSFQSPSPSNILPSSPIPIILGPTGSGKTKIAIDLALRLNGEIISADSRAIYRGLDIGTAKPTKEERSLVPHHGLDLVDLGDRFTVADWKAYAEDKIAEIKSRGHLPIIAGGTGLYIDALIFDYKFKGPTGEKINDSEQKSCSDRKEVKGDFLLIGLKIPREELRDRLRTRIDQMFTPELFEEGKKFVQNPNSSFFPQESSSTSSKNLGKNSPSPDDLLPKAGNIYRFVSAYLNGDMTLEEAKQKAFYADYHLARRQLTWFKRNNQIIWLPPDQATSYILRNLKSDSNNQA